jgi:hypothetical protein
MHFSAITTQLSFLSPFMILKKERERNQAHNQSFDIHYFLRSISHTVFFPAQQSMAG